MGHKKVVYPVTLFNATTGIMTGASTIKSAAMDIVNVDNIGIQLSWSGNATGVISVECSNDGITFNPLVFTPVLAQPAGTAGQYNIDLNQVPFLYLLLQYVNTSGTGVLLANYVAKDLN